ncbi:DeoR/GlpR family DNA-binding transcription regulator [Oceanobacillus alkalisoli]|uniref:DeoR/GlpR family DNA-binding transcription regulator n=1 Tax=Oceanobacillus alkalisoli TaxID=2925113 RepID=UPI001EF09E3C|nr:DeoR/GlpR family DNA-binding transcription regulator [Oceanobacillus alkalisoli]MCF3944537.1 DeoR/GlpR family DNA-binding transcription regulator [Oceanobacillus alkalisoli]MCG5102247.1 DeoR/GlpR family DNA-binding transcription regulator [Oceanobacillus alkalisoli]
MKMFASERRDKILQLLQDKGRVTVKELASNLDVSEATLRTDLTKMELGGFLQRTHGGAILNDSPDNDRSFSVREKKNIQEKMKIADKAFDLIEDQQCILLDASSTALALARKINESSMRLTVVTSGIQSALELKDNPAITVILVGGVVTNGSTSIEGKLGVSILDHVNIDIMFTSASGYTVENGLTDFNLYEVELKREMVKRSKKIVAIIDYSKIGKTSSSVFATTDEIDVLISEKQISTSIAKNLQDNNITVM